MKTFCLGLLGDAWGAGVHRHGGGGHVYGDEYGGCGSGVCMWERENREEFSILDFGWAIAATGASVKERGG